MSFLGLRIGHRSGFPPGPATIQGIAQVFAGAGAADAHDHVRIQLAAADIVGVAQEGRLGGATRRGLVEIPVDETGIVADGGDQLGALGRTIQS